MKRLSEVLLLKKEVAAGVRACSSLSMLERLLEIGKNQVLLISEEFPYDERKQVFEGRRIILTESHCRDLGVEEEELPKYQSVDVLAAGIMQAFQKDSRLYGRPGGRRRQIIAVYSPIHRIGKTTFSLKLGKALAEKENVLYLNLETYAGIGGFFKEEDEQDLSHLLYYVKQDDGNISIRLSSIVKQIGNLDYIPPMKVWTDLQAVAIEDWELLFGWLMKESIYDAILVDLGNAVVSVFEILKRCDRILFPSAEDVYAKAKISQYRYMQKVLGYQELEGRTLYVDMEKTLRQAVRETLERIDGRAGKERKNASRRTTS
ncbi:hypothetical protein ABXS75_01160 [Roseburia hominis]